MSDVGNSTELDIIAGFAHALVEQLQPSDCLKIDMSEHPIFSNVEKPFQSADGGAWESKIIPNKTFDFILADLPFGLNRIKHEIDGKSIKIRRNWIQIYKALQFVSENGKGVFLIEPYAFSTNDGVVFENLLNSKGFFVEALFEAPYGSLKPYTSLDPVFAVISKQPTNQVFVAELQTIEQSREVVKRYLSGGDLDGLKTGMKVPKTFFRGFKNLRTRIQIIRLKTEFKNFDTHLIEELAIEINQVRSGMQLSEKNNSIYLPSIGNSPVLSKLSDAKLKHHNYFQVVLNSDAINEYVATFFKSALGLLILDSMSSGTVIEHRNKSRVQKTLIPLPGFDEQEQILRTQHKLDDLKEAINAFESELSLNPVSSNSITSQLDGMLETINGLTEIDIVHNLLRQGESKNIEFKETLSLDTEKKTKEKYMELSVLKTIVAFFNTSGGVLLIGVNDDNHVTGLAAEISKFHKSEDKFLRHFKNLIKSRIGEGFYPFIDYKILQIDQCNILKVDCGEANVPCYLDGKEFYVRTNPATDKLEGAKLVEYVNVRFK